MTTQRDKAERFAALHRGSTPLLVPNAWDAGSAKLFAHLGFSAIATTSSAFAATLGRIDGAVTRDEALAHSAALSAATDIPVSADLENGFADDLDGVRATYAGAVEAGLAGASIEDYSGNATRELYDIGFATERVAAAAEAAHAGDVHLVLTARAENHIRGNPDLTDTIRRLQAYEAAGADVLYAPGIRTADEIRAVVDAVDRPINVLAVPGVPTVEELGELGVGRVSVGGAFGYVAYGAAADAARELLDKGTYHFWNDVGPGAQVTKAALRD
jgi:2-methylisocitrate lyase-like PEP mutase family enzyme